MVFAVNLIAYQIAWFSSVLGGANQMPWLGPLTVVIALALHLRAARRPFDELLLALCCGVIGTAFDSALVALEWVSYPSGQLGENLAPYWMISLWVVFATTLNVSMRWMRISPVLAAFFGFTGGPLTYWAGMELGAMELINPTAAMIALAIGWGLMMPLLTWLSEVLDGMPGRRRIWLAEATKC
jgi:hypothetical protein